MWQRFIDEDGQTLLEYGLLTALVSVAAISILAALGRRTRDIYICLTRSN